MTESKKSTHLQIPFLKFLNPIDVALFLYLGIVGTLILLRKDRIPTWHLLLGAHLVFILSVSWLFYHYTNTPNPILRFLRSWYPALVIPFLYEETGMLNQIFVTGYLDPIFARMDLWLFGIQPNVWLFDRLQNYWISEGFHFCYFSYYLLAPVLGIFLYFKNDPSFMRVLFGISVLFFVCYLTYIFVPAEGPLLLRKGRLDQGGFFVTIMNWIYAHAEKPGAAFPSSHVAVALMTLMYAFRLHRKLFWIFLPLVLGLMVSTVYGFYHYVVDVFSGILLCLVIDRFGEKWYAKYSHRFLILRNSNGESERE